MNTKNPQKIVNIFNKLSYRYDFLNNLFSLGLHNLWKKKLISLLNPRSGEAWADLCCGTGDIAFLLSDLVLPNGSVMGVDNSHQLLSIAKDKSNNLTDKVIIWKKKDIFDLDNQNIKFDGICMSYGLRNLKNVEEGLSKVFSLLKKNGRAGFLDFNNSRNKSFSSIFQKIYLRFIVVPIAVLFDLKDEYKYIEDSIKEFPNGNKLLEISHSTGFKEAKYITLFGGQMGLLILKK
tara:strand:- start:1554 stop:2255 length:702 start_codon:yes stop_codon:yes gene_type:complete